MSRIRFRDENRGHSCFYSSVIVLETHDIIFAKVAAALYFNEDKRLLARVFDSVRGADCDVNCLSGGDNNFAIVKRDLRSSLHHYPVFRAQRMFLVTQSLAR